MKRNHNYREKSVKPVVHVGGAVGVGAGQWVYGRGSGCGGRGEHVGGALIPGGA